MPKLTSADMEAIRQQGVDAKATTVRVGMSSCGLAAGAQEVYDGLAALLPPASAGVLLKKTGCAGMCSMEPLVEVSLPGSASVMYANVTPQIAQRIATEHVGGGKPVTEYQTAGMAQIAATAGEALPTIDDEHPPRQYRVVLRNCGVIDPESIEDYIAHGGYMALEKALGELGPEGIIGELKTSGLRGRGGAGFPTWLKWKLTREAAGDEHYIICNGDEGDPGAYMDRSVLEGDPHAVLEGLILGGLAIGARHGVFYIRAEYPLAVKRIEMAIRQARLAGLLGNNILGSEFSFTCEVRLGAGAFVCGEETALIASVEGKRGTPRPRPPYPSVKGLWDQPTMINNVETLANIAQIIIRGGEWFASIGSGKSTGTKVFAVTGKVKCSGLIEIPMGTTLRQIVEGICGGTASGGPIKAVQTGGPSGGLIPNGLLDTAVTYEHLSELGSIMGSGGMIVMDETDSVVDLARFYLGFCVEESCGKCAPCRIGGKQVLRILDRVACGEGRPDDLATVRRVAHAMQRASLCALGQTAPNPVLSALRYFGPEFDERLAASAHGA